MNTQISNNSIIAATAAMKNINHKNIFLMEESVINKETTDQTEAIEWLKKGKTVSVRDQEGYAHSFVVKPCGNVYYRSRKESAEFH